MTAALAVVVALVAAAFVELEGYFGFVVVVEAVAVAACVAVAAAFAAVDAPLVGAVVVAEVAAAVVGAAAAVVGYAFDFVEFVSFELGIAGFAETDFVVVAAVVVDVVVVVVVVGSVAVLSNNRTPTFPHIVRVLYLCPCLRLCHSEVQSHC